MFMQPEPETPALPDYSRPINSSTTRIGDIRVTEIGPEKLYTAELQVHGATLGRIVEIIRDTAERTDYQVPLSGSLAEVSPGIIHYQLSRIPFSANRALAPLHEFQYGTSALETSLKREGLTFTTSVSHLSERRELRALFRLNNALLGRAREEFFTDVGPATVIEPVLKCTIGRDEFRLTPAMSITAPNSERTMGDLIRLARETGQRSFSVEFLNYMTASRIIL